MLFASPSRMAPDPGGEREPAAGMAETSASSGATLRVGIAGATGYAGQELIRWLARHPGVALAVATGSQATSTARRLPALAPSGTARCAPRRRGAGGV